MLVTIHNLPSHMRYADIKALLQAKCGFSEVILDNLVNEGKTKKVTVGLPEEADAAILMRTMNGMFFEGMQLHVKDVRQKTASYQNDQPFYKNNSNNDNQSNTQNANYQQVGYPMSMGQYPGYNASGFQAFQPQGFQTGKLGNQQQQMSQSAMMSMMMPPMMGAMPGMYYMTPPATNSYMDHSGAGFAQTSQYPVQQDQSVGTSGPDNNRNPAWAGNGPPFNDDQRDKSPTRVKESRWSESTTEKKSGRIRRTRRSNKRGRSRDDDRLSPKRSRYSDEHRHQDDHREAHFSREPPKYSSGRNDSFDSSSINAKLMSLSNNQPRSQMNNVIRKPWENSKNSQNSKDSSNQGSFENKNQGRKPWDLQAAPVSYPVPQTVYQSQSSTGNSTGHNSRWGRNDPYEDTSSQSNRRGPSASYNTESRSPYTWTRSNQSSSEQSHSQRGRESSAPFDSKSQPQKSWERRNVTNEGAQSRNSGFYSNRGENTFSARSERPPLGNKVNPPPAARAQRPSGGDTRPDSGTHLVRPHKKNPAGDTASLIRRDASYRLQAAAAIVKDMLSSKCGIIVPDDTAVKNVKKAVRSRIEVLLPDSIGISIDDIISSYRKRFPPNQDKEFFEAVVDMYRKEALSEGATTSAPVEKQSGKQTVTPQQNTQPAPKTKKGKAKTAPPAPQEVPAMPQLLPPSEDKLPKYPNADKDVYKKMKLIQKAEQTNDHFYKRQMLAKYPEEEAALQAEVDAICNIFTNELQNPKGDLDKRVCTKILRGNTLQELRKAICLHVSKRILNVPTNLQLRVFAAGKAPKKAALMPLFAQHGVVSMKKSVGKKLLYIITCGSFAAYDKLIAMGHIQLDENTTLIIKPFHLLGPNTSIHEKRAMMKQTRRDAKQARKDAMHALLSRQVDLDADEDFIFTENESVDRLDESEIINEMKEEDITGQDYEFEDENIGEDDNVGEDDNIGEYENVGEYDNVEEYDNADEDDFDGGEDVADDGNVGEDDAEEYEGCDGADEFEDDDGQLNESDFVDW